MPVDTSQQLRLEPAVGQLVWQAWSEVQWATHMFPPLPVVDVLVDPVLVSEPVPVDVSRVVPVEAGVLPPTPLLPPTPPVVSAPEAQAAKAAGVNRAKTTKVTLACFTGL
jgi:hypothetical protein